MERGTFLYCRNSFKGTCTFKKPLYKKALCINNSLFCTLRRRYPMISQVQSFCKDRYFSNTGQAVSTCCGAATGGFFALVGALPLPSAIRYEVYHSCLHGHNNHGINCYEIAEFARFFAWFVIPVVGACVGATIAAIIAKKVQTCYRRAQHSQITDSPHSDFTDL